MHSRATGATGAKLLQLTRQVHEEMRPCRGERNMASQDDALLKLASAIAEHSFKSGRFRAGL